MPELICLTVPIPEVEQRLKLAADAAVIEWKAAWHTQYPETTETVCFLCDAAVPFPPKSLVLPDYIAPANRLLVPLCDPCCALPTMLKYGRALKMLKKMHKATTGRTLNLVFNPSLTRHPR